MLIWKSMRPISVLQLPMLHLSIAKAQRLPLNLPLEDLLEKACLGKQMSALCKGSCARAAVEASTQRHILCIQKSVLR